MKAKGFTLMELMIVVAILGIALSVVAPIFGNFGYSKACAARGMDYSWFYSACEAPDGSLHDPVLFNADPQGALQPKPQTNTERVEAFCGGPYSSAVATGSGMEYTCPNGSKVTL